MTHTRSPVPAGWRRLGLALILLLGATAVAPVHAAEDDWVYTVRPGDTLWKIANDYLISTDYWKKVQELNGIGKTRQLKPGTRLTIPRAWLRQPPASARVVALRGEVTLIRGGERRPLTVETPLQQGDRIETGEGASLGLEFVDGSRLMVAPGASVVIETLEGQSEPPRSRTVIKVIEGRVETKVRPQGKGSRYQITTPAAVAAVRGTEFRVGSAGETMRTEVVGGKVAVTGSGVTQEVGAGYATIAKVGSPPIAPRALPAAPDLSGLKKRVGGEIRFRWPQVEGAVRYRAQLAGDEHFSALLAEQVVEAPEVRWRPLEPATYFLRVRGIDELDLEGFDAVHRFEVPKPLTAPMPIAPGDGTTTRHPRPFFSWSRVEQAHAYRLQVATDENFEQIEHQFDNLINNHFKPLDALAPGTYFWRVQSLSRLGQSSAFSTPRRFTVAAPDAP